MFKDNLDKCSIETMRAAIQEQKSAIDDAKREYEAAASAYRDSFNQVMKDADDKIKDLQSEIDSLEKQRADLKKKLAGFLIKNSAAKVAEIKKNMDDLEAKAADLREQVEAVGGYVPTGDAALYEAAKQKYDVLKKAWASGTSVFSDVRGAVSDLLYELEYNFRLEVPDNYGSVYRTRDLPALSEIARNTVSVSAILKQAGDGSDYAAARDNAVTYSIEKEKADRRKKLQDLINSGMPETNHYYLNGDHYLYLHSDGKYYPSSEIF